MGVLNLPWQEFREKTFIKIEAYAGMEKHLMRYLAIEEALQTEMKEILKHNNQSYIDCSALSKKEKIRTRLNLPLHMIWSGRRYNLVGDMNL